MPASTDPTYMRLRGALQIDPLQLDREFTEHPMLLMEVMEAAASANDERDKLKQMLSIVRAQTAAKLRSEQFEDSKGNLKSKSESQIGSEIDMQDAVIEAEADYDAARFDASLWTALYESTRAKGHSLRELAALTLSGFLAPSAAYNKAKQEIAEVRKPLVRRPLPKEE